MTTGKAVDDREVLALLRERFAATDKVIVEAIAVRIELARAAGEWKVRHDVPVVDEARERAAAMEREAYARALGVDEGLVARVFAELVAASRDVQHELRPRGPG
jgi:chorismate mutase